MVSLKTVSTDSVTCAQGSSKTLKHINFYYNVLLLLRCFILVLVTLLLLLIYVEFVMDLYVLWYHFDSVTNTDLNSSAVGRVDLAYPSEPQPIIEESRY